MIHFLMSWALSAIALLFTSKLISGIHVDGFKGALLGALAIAAVNALVKPVLFVLSLPLTILTLGLFLFIVTGIAFWLASKLAPGFEIDSFGSAILGSIVLSIVNWALGLVLFRNTFLN